MNRFLTQADIPLQLNKVQKETKLKLENAIRESMIKLAYREMCICGSKNIEKIASMDRFGLDFPSYICKDCGVIFTSPYISEESLSLYYNEFYHPLTFGRYELIEFLFAKGQGIKIFNFVKDKLYPKDIKIFELGAGSGSKLSDFIEVSKKFNFNVNACGLEFNEKYVEYGNQKGLHLSSLSLQEYVKSEANKFDLIILSHVLEHFIDIENDIKLLKKISHSETLFYIEVPGVLDLKTRYEYDCDFLKYLTNAHTFNFSLNSLEHTLNMYGLELLDGNEKVESIFRINESLTRLKREEFNYDAIVTYLTDLENNLIFYQNKNPNKFLVNKIKRKVKSIIKRFTERGIK